MNLWQYQTCARVITPEIVTLAGELLRLGQEQGYGDYDRVCNVLAFTQQCITYTQDLCLKTNRILDHPKYPLETLVEGRGDCEDQAILAAVAARLSGLANRVRARWLTFSNFHHLLRSTDTAM